MKRSICILSVIVSIFAPPLLLAEIKNWHAGVWDSSKFPFIKGHPTTFALRVEVYDADSGFPLPDVEVFSEGEWINNDSNLKQDFRLNATTDSKGVAVFGLSWQEETRWSTFGTIRTIDDIEKVQRITARKRDYIYEERRLDFSSLQNDADTWKAIVTQTPRARYFNLKVGEDFNFGSKRSTDSLFFKKVRDEDYYKVFAADYFAGGKLDIPNLNERLTVGPFIALPIRFDLHKSVVERRVDIIKLSSSREEHSSQQDSTPSENNAIKEKINEATYEKLPPQNKILPEERPRNSSVARQQAKQLIVVDKKSRVEPDIISKPVHDALAETLDESRRKKLGLYVGVQGVILNSSWAGLPVGSVIESINHRSVADASAFTEHISGQTQAVVGLWKINTSGRWERSKTLVSIP